MLMPTNREKIVVLLMEQEVMLECSTFSSLDTMSTSVVLF